MILVDAHVHLHGCFSPQRFLDAAAGNMAVAVHGMGLPAATPGMLLFTHAAGDDAFGGLRPGPIGRWSLAATQETMSLSAHRADTPPLILVAGRQIETAEGLEILALGAPGPFTDGEDAGTTIEAVRAAHGVPVIPWGFGKWWGGRGALVRRLIADHARFPLLFLGDSAVRPGLAPRPRLLAQGERERRAVLPGTDPLPLAAEVDKVGRLVFRVADELDTEQPFAALKRWLENNQETPPVFGAYERAPVFMHRQVVMQLRKRLGARF